MSDCSRRPHTLDFIQKNFKSESLRVQNQAKQIKNVHLRNVYKVINLPRTARRYLTLKLELEVHLLQNRG